MLRQIIKIDEEKCNGCGLCVSACHEGAIEMQNGKAVLIKDDYCDGLGNCLPVCPTDAIKFEMRDAAEYDQSAVDLHLKNTTRFSEQAPCQCPSSKPISIDRNYTDSVNAADTPSALRQFPIQLKLVAPNASYFNNSDLLIAADCTAFAHGAFHAKFMKDKVTIIACPKLDSDDTEKLTNIFRNNSIKSISVARMSVPCCGGLVAHVSKAMLAAGKQDDIRVFIISPDGNVVS